MARESRIGWMSFLFFLGAMALTPCLAEDVTSGAKNADNRPASLRALPAEVATSHKITISGEKVAFTARAGAVQLNEARSNAPLADVAFTSYERVGVDPLTRPIVFVFNGGPGAASAWLGLGALSPWRLRFSTEPSSPSTPPIVIDNAESWLAFADLVFVDPPGTGYSVIIGDNEDLKKQFYSVQGDVDALAVVVRKWLTTHRRLASPKYLVGESYGGFRVVKLVRALRERESVSINGLVLVSPVLDFAWQDSSRNLLSFAGYLPSFAAVARDAKDRAILADVETYAANEYVTDLLKGVNDADALSRLSTNVERFTGLGQLTVKQLGGRIDVKTFSRERRRGAERVLSFYDGGVSGLDPAPFTRESDWPDPLLDSFRVPLGAAMVRLTAEKLEWRIGDARYEILNDKIANDWDFGREGRSNAEAVSDLRQALAFDSSLKVLVVHGVADLVTPYFVTKLLLDQLPAFGDSPRIRLVVLPGGHMSYIRDDSRRALRDDARTLIEQK